MPKEANNKKQSKEKKHFIKDFKAELKRVIWPTTKQLVNNTVAVITIVLITAVLVFALDFTFEKLNTYGIEKIKSVVDSKNEVENEISTEDTDGANETANEVVESDEKNKEASDNNTVNE